MEDFKVVVNNRRYSHESSRSQSNNCRRIFIACALSLLLLIAVSLVGAWYTISKYMKSWQNNKGNLTTEAQEATEFFETWRAPEHIRKRMPHALLGFDKTNQPIWYINYGHYDFKTILADDSNVEALDLYRDQSMYRIRKSMRMRERTGSNHNQTWSCITDMDGFAFSQAVDIKTLAYLKHVATEYKEFLKTLDYCIVINMNTFARYFVAAVRPFLDGVVERVYIFGYDKEEWMPFMHEKINKDQLPQDYGGYANFTPIVTYFD